MPPRMFPSTLKDYDFKEPGEERVFELLKGLTSDCYVWYEVVLGVRSRKPDFFILDPNRGIKILEVKDWGKSTIRGASPTMVKIKAKGNNIQTQKNPGRKCLVYIEEASEKLEIDPLLVGKHDKLGFPIDYLVVFPNLSQDEFNGLNLSKYLDEERILFSEEVKKPSLFLERLQSSGDNLTEPLSNEMMNSVRKHLREDITIDSPGGGLGLLPGVLPEGEIELAEELTPDVFAIDMEQEELAKELGDGPRLMRGIAGTGKTLIMLIRAKLIASNMEQQNKPVKILILCWNVSLANYMRQAFDHINIPLDGYVPIIHFAEFARKLVNSHVESPPFPRVSDPEFEDKITQRLKKLRITAVEKYDYVFIDEAQDFQDEWIKFIFDKMVKGTDPKIKNLVMAADDAQKVYKSRDFSWEGLGIPMRGARSTILRKIYRNSPRIWGFAAFLLRDIAKYYDDNPDLRFSIKRGVDPKLIECETSEDQIEESIKEIKNIGESGYSWRNVLILYQRTRTYDGYPIVDQLISRLRSEKIPYQWITESMDTKNTFRWGEDSVKISTAASAKGLDAPKVIILSAESFGAREEPEYDELKMMYVSLTRAREELVILHTGDGGLVPELQRCMKMFKKYKPRLIKMEEAGD